jgi:hypothetical protein
MLSPVLDKWSNSMRANIHGNLIIFSGLILVGATAFTAIAKPPADHPGFFHALENLRYARAHLQRPEGGELQIPETRAIQAIDAAIGNIKLASSTDSRPVNTKPRDEGKYLNNDLFVDAQLDWPNRLRRAVELVNKAHSYVLQEQPDSSDETLQRLRHQALEDIDKARRNIEEALHAVH